MKSPSKKPDKNSKPIKLRHFVSWFEIPAYNFKRAIQFYSKICTPKSIFRGQNSIFYQFLLNKIGILSSKFDFFAQKVLSIRGKTGFESIKVGSTRSINEF